MYKTKVGNQGNEKWVSIKEGHILIAGTIRTEDDSAIPGCPLTLVDCQLKVRHQRGDITETDYNYDSEYMLGAMDRVGQVIRESFHCSPASTSVI